MDNRIDRIAEKVFLASARCAKLEPDYDSIQVDKDKGIFIELDGNIDYDSIDNAFDNEKKNLKEIADEVSAQLVNENKEYMQKTFGMDVDSIDSGKYKIIHNDKDNKMYLFLPAAAVNTKKQKHENEAVNDEEGHRTMEIVKRLEDALTEFVNANKIRQGMSPNDKTAYIVADTATASDDFGEYVIDVKLERVSGKHEGIFETNLYLKMKYNGETIYDKVVRNQIKFSKFNLQTPETNGDRIVFQIPQDKDGRRDFFANADKFIKEVTKKDDGSIAAFKKDLNSDKVQKKLNQEIDDLYGEYDYGNQMR